LKSKLWSLFEGSETQ